MTFKKILISLYQFKYSNLIRISEMLKKNHEEKATRTSCVASLLCVFIVWVEFWSRAINTCTCNRYTRRRKSKERMKRNSATSHAERDESRANVAADRRVEKRVAFCKFNLWVISECGAPRL